MNPIFYIFILFIATISMGSSCCKKDEPVPPAQPTLPPATQTGANTFGCLVNGVVWLPKGGGLLPTFSADYGNKTILIKANKADVNPYQFINLNCGPIVNDTLLIISNYQDSISFQNFRYAVSLTYYYPISGKTGEFNLTKLDTTNRILSGTFWFDAIDTVTNNVVQIREGRFDVKYN